MTTLAIARTHGHAWQDVDSRAGLLSGVIASLAMGMVAMGATLAQGRGLFFVPEKIATLVLSDAAASTALGVATGLAVHVGLGGLFGVMFAGAYTLLTNHYGISNAAVLGLIFGFGLWAANFLIIGPAVGAQLTASMGAELAIPAHLVFGLALSLYPLLARDFEGGSAGKV